MNILQAITSLHIGGAERIVYALASSINSDRFTVAVLVTKEEGIIADKLRDRGITIYSPPPKEKNILYKINYLHSIILQSNCDIIHSHGTAALIDLAPLYVLKKMVPLVHTFHFGNYPHLKKSYLWAERFMVRYAQRLIAVSNHQRQMIINHHKVPPSVIETIWNGVDDNPYINNAHVSAEVRREFHFTQDDIIVGVVAVLSRQKGLDYFLDAAAQLIQDTTNIKFLIVGGGPLEEELMAKARTLQIDRFVTFTGWREDARKIMLAFDIFVLPSLWEGLPVVLLEAMAAEKSIIVTDVGDNRSLIGENERGILVPPGDSKALCQAITQLVNNRQLADRLKQNACSYYKKNLTTAIMVRKYEDIYRQAIGRYPHI